MPFSKEKYPVIGDAVADTREIKKEGAEELGNRVLLDLNYRKCKKVDGKHF